MCEQQADLNSRLQTLWAKKNLVDGRQRWLPLLTHLRDTALTINQLYNTWLSRSQRQILGEGLTPEQAQGLVKFIGFTHDIGKALPNFQRKPSYAWNASPSLDQELLDRLVSVGFVGLADANLPSARETPHAKAGEAILERAGVAPSVAALVGGHHGKPTEGVVSDDIHNYTSNYWQDDQDEAIQRPWQEAQAALLSEGLAFAGFDSPEVVPAISQPQAVILEGLLIMADWLASSEYLDNDPEKPMFPLISIDETYADIDQQARFEAAWSRWEQTEPWQPRRVSPALDPYYDRWGFHARPVQQAITTAIGESEDAGIVIVEAPMGLGKTEIALVAAEQLARQAGEDGIFFGLPTQATANAMMDRMIDWVAYQADTEASSLPVRLVHGKAYFNEHFRSLPEASNVGDDTGVVVNRWFGGKKAMLDAFIVGTIDHLLLMALKQKHLALRHLGLSKKVVILDEVHAYDAFMDEYLYKALAWLGSYHVPVVILSATLPKAKRNKMLKQYFNGKYPQKFNKEVDLSAVSADWEQTEAYPLLTMLDGKQIKQVTDFDQVSDQAPKAIEVVRVVEDDEALVADVLTKLSEGGVAGIIVNTVKRAQDLAMKLNNRVPLIVLHSAFTAPDRAALEQALQAAIGKHAQRPQQMVVIGTQVLEQSLDIDFDILYSDIAPIDLLLQRAGRLQRHDLPRPEKLNQPKLVVMNSTTLGDYSDANEGIYGKYLLMQTDRYLPATIHLPSDISRLVQQVYQSAMDEYGLDEVLRQDLRQAREDYDSKIAEQQREAKIFAIKAPPKNAAKTLHGWLSKASQGADINEQKASASVRDIEETLEVLLIQRTDQGDRLLDGRLLQDCASVEIAEQLIRLPTAITRYHMDEAIKVLEDQTARHFTQWQFDSWLKGALALVLDDQLQVEFLGYQLQYSSQLGLSYVKEGGTP